MLTKAFRLFVSSTFADFAAERDLLQGKVFPALDAYCATRGYQFLPIDMRWGVNEEGQLDQRATEICLGEVQAAKGYPRPNFLIMVGNRYGWVPLPFAIACDEFEELVAWLAGNRGEATAGLVRRIYSHDENRLMPRGLLDEGRRPDVSLTTTYTLRSREDELVEFKRADAWAEVETKVREALQEASDHLARSGRIDARAHKKYYLSLTEQEIMEGVPGYRDADANPVARPARQTADDAAHSIVFLRQIEGVEGSAPGEVSVFVDNDPRLDAVKARLRQTLPGNSIVTVRARLENGGVSQQYLASFEAAIQSKLRAAIDRHIAEVEALEQDQETLLEVERAAHREFRQQKLKIWVGRQQELGAIERYVSGAGQRPLVVHGPSGLGKSSLMARAIAAAEAAGRTAIVYRFVGASPDSSVLRSLLISVAEELAADDHLQISAEFEQDEVKFGNQIKMLLSSISAPVTIFLDALDQLQNAGSDGWLPHELPKQLKIVISVLDDAAYATDSRLYRRLAQRLAPQDFLSVKPLGTASAREILAALETDSQRRLRDAQRAYILQQFERAGGSPLYLHTAFQIAKSWRSTGVAGQGPHALAADTANIIAQFFADLTQIHHHEPELTTRVVGYLAATKDGLSVKEMIEVLSRDNAVMQAISSERHGARTDRLPASVWVRLSRQLAHFLVEKRVDDQPVLQFFHRQVAEIARSTHYAPRKVELHTALAAYFDTRVVNDGNGSIYDKRSLSELPYQLHHAGNTGRLSEILLSPSWMRQKLTALGVRRLIDDYEFALSKAHRITGQALDLAAGTIERNQVQLMPQLLGRLNAALARDSPQDAKLIMALRADARKHIETPALVPRWPRLTAPGGAEIRRLDGHTRAITAVAFSPDGQHVVSGSSDDTLRLWNLRSGQSRSLEGHTESVRSVAFSPDGRYVVSGSFDKTVRLWDLETGQVKLIEGPTDDVLAVAFSPDGRLIASSSPLQLFDRLTGKVRVLDEARAASIAFSPDGRSLLSNSPNLLHWDIESGKARLIAKREGVTLLAFFPDRRRALSGGRGEFLSFHRTPDIQVWDLASRRSRKYRFHWLEDALDDVGAIGISPDGSKFAVGFGAVLRLWDTAGETSRKFIGHTEPIAALAFSPDGRQVVSGSHDRTLRIWDVEAIGSHDEATVSKHPAAAFSPDGSRLLSYGRRLQLWDIALGRPRKLRSPDQFDVSGLAFSPSGLQFATGTRRGRVRLWDVNSDQTRLLKEGEKEWGEVRSVGYSADGKFLVVGAMYEPLRRLDVRTGRARKLLRSKNSDTDVVFSPDRRHFISFPSRFLSFDMRDFFSWKQSAFRLWDAETLRSKLFKGRRLRMRAVAFSPDARRIASVSEDKRLLLWQVETQEAEELSGNRSFRALEFAADGRHIISTGSSGTYIWDTSNPGSGHELTDYDASMAFACGGRYAAVGSNKQSADKALHLFDTGAGSPWLGQERARLDGDAAFVAIATSPDADSLAAIDAAGRVHLVDVVIDDEGKSAWLQRHDDRDDHWLPADDEDDRSKAKPDKWTTVSPFRRSIQRLWMRIRYRRDKDD